MQQTQHTSVTSIQKITEGRHHICLKVTLFKTDLEISGPLSLYFVDIHKENKIILHVNKMISGMQIVFIAHQYNA